MGSWTRDPAVAAYVEERLNRRNVYRGIGESHFGADDVEAPTVRRIAELAKSRDCSCSAMSTRRRSRRCSSPIPA